MSLERSHPRLIPVLDVMNGRVVRAVGGRRDEYRPLVSTLTDSTEVYPVAMALVTAVGRLELYLADLDAIRGFFDISPEVNEFAFWVDFPIWLELGVSARKGVEFLASAPGLRPVVGLETAGSPSVLTGAVAGVAAPVAFSLDLRDGELMGDWSKWGAAHSRDALAVAHTAVRAGAKALIVLDVARVGTGTGAGTEPLLRAIRDEFPAVDLIAGGGVRTWADVDRLGEAGATGVLVASALHDGTLKLPRG